MVDMNEDGYVDNFDIAHESPGLKCAGSLCNSSIRLFS